MLLGCSLHTCVCEVEFWVGEEDWGREEDGERTELWWPLGEQDKAGLGSWKM